MEKRTVPSFGSFKPRPTPAAPIQKDTPKEDREPSPARSRRDHSRRDEGRHESRARRDRSHDRRRERKDDRHRRDREQKPRYERHKERSDETKSLAQDESEESEYFMIDRRGDAKNVEYGGLHRYSVPAYHRIGYGRVLGANQYTKIDRDASAEKGIPLRSDSGKAGGRAERLLSKKNLKHAGSQRLILPKVEDGDAGAAMEIDADFLALRPNLKRKRGSEFPGHGAPGIDYRSVEGKAKPDPRPQEEDLESGSSSDETQEDVASDTRIRARNAELSRAAKTDPTNVDAWLALVEHQAQSTFPGIDLDDLTSSQRRSVADIRLSVLTQAFEQISVGTTGHERLLLAYISEGSKIWDASKISQKWKDALKQHSGSLLLWREYLSYLQTTHASFRYDTCKDAYMECLETLSKSYAIANAQVKSTIGNTIVYVLLRFTNFVRDAGYDELAVAIWQAVLEHCLLSPKLPNGHSKLDAFEEFWESDVPRIGEEGAGGWRASTSTSSFSSRKTSMETWPTFDQQKPFASFATIENSITTLLLPAGTADDEEESDDPFRHVMFSDIRRILELLPEQLDTKLLIDAFLRFMHLPPIDQQISYSNQWRSDPFLQSSPSLQGSNDVNSQQHDSFSLFHDAFQSCSANEASTFIHRALSTVITVVPDFEELGEYLLAFICRTNSSETTKTAKRLLKSRPTSLRYYNAYALSAAGIAKTSDQMEKATQIWMKALELYSTLSKDARDDAILLWHSQIMTHIHRGEDGTALQTLLAVPDGSATALPNPSGVTSAGAVLRARRHLEENFDRMLLKHKTEHAALYADCLAWLLYLSAKQSITAALQSFATTSTRLHKADGKHALELLHQAKARLLSQQMSAKRPFKPTLFRDELAESRRLFPENSFILERYYEVARLTRLDDRLRSALSEASTSSPAASQQGLVSWLFAIDAEIARCSIDGASATKDSVRALFRRALLSSDSTIKSSQLLWKRWFNFESSALRHFSDRDGSQRRDAVRKAKQVFFDGLRFLPWSKGWIVDGMATFAESGDMGEEALRQVHDVLVERELRMRVEVEDLGRDA